MTLVKWNPGTTFGSIGAFDTLQDEINRLFDLSFEKKPVVSGIYSGTDYPVVDVFDNDNEIVVRADIPGVEKDKIEISVTEDALTIKGCKEGSKEDKEKNYYRSERSYGCFQRAIGLPSEVEHDKINATYTDGVLEVKLPKAEKAKPKQISVKAN
jgi:HSP20 family protein